MSDTLFDLLEGTVADLHDMPVFKPWPAGSYLVELETSIEEMDRKLADGTEIVAKVPKLVYKFLEVIDLKDPNAEAPREDAKIVSNIFLSNKAGERSEFGEGQLKMTLVAVQGMYPEAKNNGELIVQANGTRLAITVEVKKRKDKDTQEIREENRIITVVNPEELG